MIHFIEAKSALPDYECSCDGEQPRVSVTILEDVFFLGLSGCTIGSVVSAT